MTKEQIQKQIENNREKLYKLMDKNSVINNKIAELKCTLFTLQCNYIERDGKLYDIMESNRPVALILKVRKSDYWTCRNLNCKNKCSGEWGDVWECKDKAKNTLVVKKENIFT
ncbi:MAG: hypothetical protein WC783_00305 [Candidatus Paceibacterota bacterium]|jgi:hypothetical protein